ncbi:piwi, putative [Bodo saltans]|uniref:Piwi, putative n=1 Tax=Bodo saltans TaxID=75058 RepID=A0A0S4J625_BODSA|nr:piwi, putative [Bodo saltans]|eukprot:CUG84703.1 piwi, putative [Bodo saltans]
MQVRHSLKNNVAEVALVYCNDAAITEVPDENAVNDAPIQEKDDQKSNQLALRLDTKSLVAAEQSLLDEIQQHYGNGPYTEDVQRRIARAVQGTPFVVSTNLRHASVRVVKFGLQPETVQLEPHLKAVQGDIVRGQPYAILHDHSIVPLQALHCCFDPKMRTWQDVTVATCSFIPQKRVGVLAGFRTALEQGLGMWGIQLAKEPYVSKSLAILEAPSKGKYQPQSQSPKPTMPTSILFCSIASDRTGSEDRDKIITTAQHLAKEFNSPYHAHCASEVDAVAMVEANLCDGGRLRDVNSAVVFVTSERDTRASRWLVGECLRRGILPVCIPGVAKRRQGLLVANVRVNIRTKFELDPLKGINVGQEVPAIANKCVLSVGIDCCNNPSGTIGAAVGVLTTPQGNKIFSTFWRNTVRGREVEQVAEQFGFIIQQAMKSSRLDEVIVLQDGNVFSELQTMKKRVPVGCGITFMCLHKRTNIRFMHHSTDKNVAANATRGTVIQSHTPSPLLFKPLAPSFYLQSHECPMSTARCVEYTVHAVSESLDIPDVQKLAHCMSHVFAPIATKLPLPTRCAHRLGAIAERIIDASPDFQCQEIPDALGSRMWFL